MKQTNAFIYKWTHLPTMKWYLGSKSSKGCHVDDGYICSSKTVKPMIKANPEEWVRTIVEEFGEDVIACVKAEAEMLDLLNAKDDPRSFNMHNGDGVCNNTKNREATSKSLKVLWENDAYRTKMLNATSISSKINCIGMKHMSSVQILNLRNINSLNNKGMGHLKDSQLKLLRKNAAKASRINSRDQSHMTEEQKANNRRASSENNKGYKHMTEDQINRQKASVSKSNSYRNSKFFLNLETGKVAKLASWFNCGSYSKIKFMLVEV